MIKKEEQYFINRLNRFFPSGTKNIGFVYSFAHYGSLVEEPAFYYPEKGKEDPVGCFKVSRKKFNDYEKNTPYHFAGFAQMFGMAEEDRHRRERLINEGKSTYFSDRWKLTFGDNNFDEINKRIEEYQKDFEENNKKYWDLRSQEPELLIAKAVQIINTELGKCNGGVRITDLFAADPVGWTVPVRINIPIRTNEDFIGGKDTLGAYVYDAENGVLKNEKGEAVNGYPYNLRSWIEIDPVQLLDFAQKLNADSKFLIRAYFGNAPISLSEDTLYDALIDICERGFSFDDLVGIYVYVLAHEIFHAWQDYHIGLWYTSKNLTLDKRNQGFEESETLAEFFAIHFVWSILKNRPLAFLLCANRMRETEYDGPNGYTDVVKKNVLCDNSKKDFFKELSDWEDLMIAENYSKDQYLAIKGALSKLLLVDVADLISFVKNNRYYPSTGGLDKTGLPADMLFINMTPKKNADVKNFVVEEMEKEQKEDFGDVLRGMIRAHGNLIDAEICTKANLRKDTLSKLWKSHKNINRDWIWALAVGLGLNAAEVKQLLDDYCKKEKKDLTEEEKEREKIFLYFIVHRNESAVYTVRDLNDWLDLNDEKLFGRKIKPLGNYEIAY